MKRGFRIFVVAACAVLLACAAVSVGAAPKQKDFVIGFANGYFGNTWRAQFMDEAQAAADKWIKKGIIKKFIPVQVNDDVTKQIVQLNSLIDQGVDCLVINPVSAEALAPVIKRAKQAKVLVVNVDDPFAYEGVYSVIQDQHSQFGIQAKWLAEQLKDKGDVNAVYISGLAGNTASNIRDYEMDQILKQYPNIHLLGRADGGWNETKAQQIMSNFLASYPKIDAVFTQDIAPFGELRAYDIAGKPYPMMNLDYVMGTLRKWAAVPNFKSIAYNDFPSIGMWGVEFAVRLLMGGKVKPEMLVPSPVNAKIKSTILIQGTYIVTLDGTCPPEVFKAFPQVTPVSTKVVSLKEALKIGEGQPDTWNLDTGFTDEQVDSYFVSSSKTW
jgi:ABC-type sugar transport system substrate-binding protein